MTILWGYYELRVRMFSETDFHKRGNLMFLVVNGRYYNTSNSGAAESDYLSLCGLRFPLRKGMKIDEEERNYMKKNHDLFDNFRKNIRLKIDSKESSISDISNNLEKIENLIFFLNDVCPCYDEKLKRLDINDRTRIQNLGSDKSILSELLNQNYAIINGRIYPLKQTETPVFVNLEGKTYTFDASNKLVDEVEADFHQFLQERLEKQSIEDSKRMLGEIGRIQNKLCSLEIILNVSKFPCCYEYGNVGYDSSIKSIYWLVAAHYNKTTGKHYKEGQSSAMLPINNSTLGTVGIFAERNDRVSPFELSGGAPHFGGLSLVGNSLRQKIRYLHTLANAIAKQGALRCGEQDGGYNQDY